MPEINPTSILWYQQSPRNKPKDMTGQRFGKLVCLSLSHVYDGHAYWVTQCDCGVVSIKNGGDVRRGYVKSCGCIRKARVTTHGQSKTNIYKIWTGLFTRCYNPNCKSYFRYGGAGITVCQRWHIFENFRDDMGPRPSLGHSVERRDGTKGYSPENCYWGTDSDQARNKRTTIYLIVDGVKRPLMEWVDITGLPRTALVQRYKAGWPHKQIVSQPLRSDKRRKC